MTFRKPWYWTERAHWYFDARTPGGGRKRIALSVDKEDAFRIWEQDFKPAEIAREELRLRIVVGQHQEAVNQDKAAAKAADKRGRLSVQPKSGKPVALVGVRDQFSSDAEAGAGAQSSEKFNADTEIDINDLSPHSGCERRLRQLERALVIVEVLAPLRHGAWLAEIHQDVNEILGATYCERTLYRDLAMLNQFGVVDRRGTHFTWRDSSVRAAMSRQFAEVIAARREGIPVAG